MSVSKCCVSVIGLCYILCMLQHFDWGGAFFGRGVGLGIGFSIFVSPAVKKTEK